MKCNGGKELKLTLIRPGLMKSNHGDAEGENWRGVPVCGVDVHAVIDYMSTVSDKDKWRASGGYNIIFN